MQRRTDNGLHCRVCGLFQGEPQWPDGCPSFAFCDCCGVEFGYQDNSAEAARLYRKDWVNGGAAWNKPDMKPTGWIMEEQFRFIPQEFCLAYLGNPPALPG
jgi:hypothetical protein